jgi:hypothetical protein
LGRRTYDVKRPPIERPTEHQAAGAALVMRIVLQYAGRTQRVEEFIECNRIFDHLLVSVLRDAHSLCRCECSNVLYDRIYITRAVFVGHTAFIAGQCAAGAVRRM